MSGPFFALRLASFNLGALAFLQLDLTTLSICLLTTFAHSLCPANDPPTIEKSQLLTSAFCLPIKVVGGGCNQVDGHLVRWTSTSTCFAYVGQTTGRGISAPTRINRFC